MYGGRPIAFSFFLFVHSGKGAGEEQEYGPPVVSLVLYLECVMFLAKIAY